MFPLRDVHRPSRTPIITRLLVLLNIAAFAWQFWLALHNHQNAMLMNLAVRPNCYFAPGACGIALPDEAQFLWQPLLTSMFLHGGWLHIAGNLWFLWVFGPAVEEQRVNGQGGQLPATQGQGHRGSAPPQPATP